MYEGAPTNENEILNSAEITPTPEAVFEMSPENNSTRQALLEAFGEKDEEVSVDDVEELLERIQQDTGLPREEVERRYLTSGAE